jgi:hypothetical protein
VICGCFVGTVEEFEYKASKIHGDNLHGVAYRKYIEIVRMIMEAEK